MDIHENESGYSLLGPEHVTAAPEPPSPPLATVLEQSVPNPFNPATTIRFSIGEPGWVVLRVYDVTGRTVRTLVDCRREAAVYEEVWDGCDDSGDIVRSGVYLYKLEASAYMQARKMVLLH